MEVTVLHVPKTKAAPLEGEDIFWSHQHGPTGPYKALANHQLINNPSDMDHLLHINTKGAFGPSQRAHSSNV